MASVILGSELRSDGRIIVGRITKAMFKEFKCTSMDTDGIVEQLRLTDGVLAAIFCYQLDRKTYKYSLRAKGDVDVSTIAVSFGGGGHVKAAGFESSEKPDLVIDRVISMIESQLDV